MQPAHHSDRASHARFEATHWSEVLEAARSGATHGPEALARLCERYWQPLYAFARRRGHSPDDAQDLVQGFFEHLIESRALGTIDQAKGRFRSFLLASFQNFSLTEQRRAQAEKRGGRAQMVRIDWKEAESRVDLAPADGLTPETVFDARWAFELLNRATRRLEQEQTTRGKAQMFSILRPYLGDEGARVNLSYEQAARALNVGLPTLKTLIHRLRRRHAQLLREEVAQTVLDPDDVESELHALCEALVVAGGRVQA
ncbi:MAG: sigma-70 family RNA polymerase sigma factor [Verrucomicrobia bacterium]|nr:sigma-70 family RNA polymerase sigma factor [Verrucomicrobiota bacterium]